MQFQDVTFLKGNCAPDEEDLWDRWDGDSDGDGCVLKATSAPTPALRWLHPEANPPILLTAPGFCTPFLMWQTYGLRTLFSALLCGLGCSHNIAQQQQAAVLLYSLEYNRSIV